VQAGRRFDEKGAFSHKWWVCLSWLFLVYYCTSLYKNLLQQVWVFLGRVELILDAEGSWARESREKFQKFWIFRCQREQLQLENC